MLMKSMSEIRCISLVEDGKGECNDNILQELTVVNHQDDMCSICMDVESRGQVNDITQDIITTKFVNEKRSVPTPNSTSFCWISICKKPGTCIKISNIEVVSNARHIEVYGEKCEFLYTAPYTECLHDEHPTTPLYYINIQERKISAAHITLKFVSLSLPSTLVLEAILVHVTHCKPTTAQKQHLSMSPANRINVDQVVERMAESAHMTSEKQQLAADLLTKMQLYQKLSPPSSALVTEGGRSPAVASGAQCNGAAGGSSTAHSPRLPNGGAEPPQTLTHTHTQPLPCPHGTTAPDISPPLSSLIENHVVAAIQKEMSQMEERILERIEKLEQNVMEKLDCLHLQHLPRPSTQ